MNKFVAVAAAGVVALTTVVAATAPSQAFYPHPYWGYGPGVPFAAGVVGFMAGAALANAASRDAYYDRGDWGDHVAACESAYRTYSPRDDAYTPRIDSRGRAIRVPCQL